MKRLGLIGAAVLLGSGCGPSVPPATFTQIYAAMFPVETRGQCNYCHIRPPNDLSDGKLSTGDTKEAAWTALVGPDSVSAKCGSLGYKIVVPGSPEKSLLYLKVNPSPLCGDRMPQGGSPLTDAQLEMVRSWIAAGAKND